MAAQHKPEVARMAPSSCREWTPSQGLGLQLTFKGMSDCWT